MKNLRALYGCLAIAGCFYGLCAIGLAAMCLLPPYSDYTYRDVLFSGLVVGLAVSGCFIWLNWLSYSALGRFYPNSGVLVQAVSFLHHSAWLALFCSISQRFDWERDLLLVCWVVADILIAFATGLMFWFSDAANTEPPDAMDSR
jgi:FlaA1/EpsC-like NDP-sugar epimerase